MDTVAGRSVDAEAGPLPSGTYLCRVIATAAGEGMAATGRMTLVKYRSVWRFPS